MGAAVAAAALRRRKKRPIDRLYDATNNFVEKTMPAPVAKIAQKNPVATAATAAVITGIGGFSLWKLYNWLFGPKDSSSTPETGSVADRCADAITAAKSKVTKICTDPKSHIGVIGVAVIVTVGLLVCILYACMGGQRSQGSRRDFRRYDV